MKEYRTIGDSCGLNIDLWIIAYHQDMASVTLFLS